MGPQGSRMYTKPPTGNQHQKCAICLWAAGEVTESWPYNVTGVLRQRNMAQIKEEIKTPEKELSDKEIENLSDAEFKMLVIRMLTEMIEYGCKIKEEAKAAQSEIKKNIQGTKSEWKETGTQINDLQQKEEINIQPEQNEEFKNSGQD